MTDINVDDNRGQINFQSVDSAPKKFAGFVSQLRAPGMLLMFVLVGWSLLWVVNLPAVNAIFPNHDFIFSPYEGRHSIAFRIFILSFFVSFALFSSGAIKARVLFGLDMIITFIFVCAIFDLANVVLYKMVGIRYSLHFTEIASGLLGFAVYSFKLLERGRMPSRIKIDIKSQRDRKAFIRLSITITIAVIVSVTVDRLDLEIVRVFRNFALLGGIGPGVFLFLPTLFAQLYALAILDEFLAKRDDFRPGVSIIVPAHNEEYIIKDTIEAMDKAAAHYGGDVFILIMNNNSDDATEEIANETIAACKSARGRVINVKPPGKAHALNAGLDAVETEFMVRVDADTLVGEDNITRAMSYFSDPRVGVVGGVPIPPGGALFDRARLLEVLVKHGFYSVAMAAVSGVVGIPGMFVVFRTEHPRLLGGFVEGMNGEDTDLSLRVGALGLVSVVDPKLRYISEVPASYHHMREQRMRWFRSIYHISSRCRDLIYSRQLNLRGKIILPYMLINSGRRAMLVPLILFGLLEYLSGMNPSSPLIWQAIVAVMVGAPAIVAAIAALLNGMPRGLIALPEYLIFRVLRAYFTLESMLSILIKSEGEELSRAYLKDIRVDRPLRIA